jgi:hypothetical protein
MQRKGMTPEDIDSVLDSSKLRYFVTTAMAALIEALDEDMDAEEYATRVAVLTAPARQQRSAAGACPAPAQPHAPAPPPPPPSLPHTHAHTTPLSRAPRSLGTISWRCR